jgi:hypothetical protein
VLVTGTLSGISNWVDVSGLRFVKRVAPGRQDGGDAVYVEAGSCELPISHCWLLDAIYSNDHA